MSRNEHTIRTLAAMASAFAACATVATAPLGGFPGTARAFNLPMQDVITVSQPDYPNNKQDGEDEAAYAARLLAEIEQAILQAGPETVGAMILDPVSYSAGCIVPPAGYLSGFVGKSHLDISGDKKDKKEKGNKFEVLLDHLPPHQGFAEYFRGEMIRYYASHGLDGKPFPDAPRLVQDDRFRVVVQTEDGSYVERAKD